MRGSYAKRVLHVHAKLLVFFFLEALCSKYREWSYGSRGLMFTVHKQSQEQLPRGTVDMHEASGLRAYRFGRSTSQGQCWMWYIPARNSQSLLAMFHAPAQLADALMVCFETKMSNKQPSWQAPMKELYRVLMIVDKNLDDFAAVKIRPKGQNSKVQPCFPSAADSHVIICPSVCAVDVPTVRAASVAEVSLLLVVQYMKHGLQLPQKAYSLDTS